MISKPIGVSKLNNPINLNIPKINPVMNNHIIYIKFLN